MRVVYDLGLSAGFGVPLLLVLSSALVTAVCIKDSTLWSCMMDCGVDTASDRNTEHFCFCLDHKRVIDVAFFHTIKLHFQLHAQPSSSLWHMAW